MTELRKNQLVLMSLSLGGKSWVMRLQMAA